MTSFLDAGMFYGLEAWVSRPDEPFMSHFLTQVELYQRYMTTAAFRLAGGVDSSSSMKLSKQHPVPPALVTKITTTFLDAIYAILDGMILLASDESTVPTPDQPRIIDVARVDLNPLGALDLKDSVCYPDLQL